MYQVASCKLPLTVRFSIVSAKIKFNKVFIIIIIIIIITILNKEDTVFPSFSMIECAVYFTKTLAAVHPGIGWQTVSYSKLDS